MATQLNQVLQFVAVPVGGTAGLPHNININGLKLLPDLLFPDNPNFSLVSATTTTITVMNNGVVPLTLNLWLWRQHTIDRAYGAKLTTSLSPQPFWVSGGGSGGISPVTQFTQINQNAGPLAIGTPVYSSSSGHVDKARGNAAITAILVGIVTATTAPGAPTSLERNVPVVATTAQWDARTGQVGGLTPGAQYYISDATAGMLLVQPGPVAPGAYSTLVGQALDANTLLPTPTDPVGPL